MGDLFHDLHFHINFLVKDAILHEAALLQLLGSVGDAIELVSDFVDNCKSTLANTTNSIVLLSTSPLSNTLSRSHGGGIRRGSSSCGK